MANCNFTCYCFLSVALGYSYPERLALKENIKQPSSEEKFMCRILRLERAWDHEN